MAVQENLLPSHTEKTLKVLKAIRAVNRITFNPFKRQSKRDAIRLLAQAE